MQPGTEFFSTTRRSCALYTAVGTSVTFSVTQEGSNPLDKKGSEP